MTPLAPSAAGNPGSVLSNNTGRSASADRLAAAKAIAAGENPISVTTDDPQVARAQANIRKIKMRTQVSTNRDYEQDIEPETTGLSTESAISDTNVSEEAEVTKPLSPQFAALAKQKRALQVKESELAKREEALKATPQEGGLDLKRLKADPLSVLQEAGVTYEQLTEEILNQGNSLDPESLRKQIKEELKKEFTEEFSTRDAQAEQQVRAEIRKEINSLVVQGDDYELIRETRSQQDVDDLIYKTWQKTGEILDTKEACELVETELIEDSLKLARLKKVQGRIAPEPQMPQQSQRGQFRTLTNKDNARPVSDRRARALAAFNKK